MLPLKCIPEKEYLAYVDGCNQKMLVMITDRKTQKTVATELFNEPADFLKSIPKIFDNQIKAVILNIFRASSSYFLSNLKFCEAIRKKLDEMNILCHFVSNPCYIITTALINENVIPSLHSSISVAIIFSNFITVYNCQSTAEGYKIDSSFNVEYDENDDIKIIYEKILRSSTPNKIIATAFGNYKKSIFERLKEKSTKLGNFVAFEARLATSAPKFAYEVYKWLMDKSYINYHVIPISARKYFHHYGNFDVPLVKFNDSLPYKTTYEYRRQSFIVTFIEHNNDDPKILQKLEFDDKCQVHDITLSIDVNHFPCITTKSILLPQIKELPQKFNKTVRDHSPVIVIYDAHSYICMFNKSKGEYEFCDEWNGIYGRPLYISFDKEKPQYFEDAVKVYKTKPSFVVHDLIILMSFPADELHALSNESYSPWSFTLTKDDKNPLLLEFDNFDGTKKAASPEFLMALLLKQHLKVIAAKTGEKPKKLACYLVDLDPNDKCLVESICEAFKLLKIDVICLYKKKLN